jgi:DNA-binding LytR/AlgR family response regulator
LRVLIVDNEPLARSALENILDKRGDVQGYDSANDAIEALDKVTKDDFDVLLLDIKMPEVSGIELIDRLKQIRRPAPAVVFVTAHDEHAIAAFERHAVDYVLKPFSEERIGEALDVAYRRTEDEKASRLVNMLPQFRKCGQRQSTRIAFKAKGRIIFIDLADVMAVKAEGNYVLLLRQTDSYLLRESISVMAEKLQRYGFVRIHRSVLVNSAFVESVQPWLTGEYGLRLKGGKEYTVSRTFKKNLRSLADFWIGDDAASNE